MGRVLRIPRADDANRASGVVEAIAANGSSALTGGLAVAAQLRAHGRPIRRSTVNDVDLIVDRFDAPRSPIGFC